MSPRAVTVGPMGSNFGPGTIWANYFSLTVSSFRVLVGVKDKVSPPRLPGNVRFGRRVIANGGRRPVTRTGYIVTVSALRV